MATQPGQGRGPRLSSYRQSASGGAITSASARFAQYPVRPAAFLTSYLRCVREIVAGDDAVQLVLEPVERVALELPHPLTRDAELLADRLE
jgi:hypothetical protein